MYRKFYVVMVIIISPLAHTLIVKLADLNTMAQKSDIVVHAYVGDQRVVSDDLGRPITLTDIEVIDALLGAKTGEVITIYQVGGSKNGVMMPLLGGHQYRLGQEIIFLGLKLDDLYVSYGAGQGKLDVVSQAENHIIVEDLGNINIMNNNHEIITPLPLQFDDKNIIKAELKAMIKLR